MQTGERRINGNKFASNGVNMLGPAGIGQAVTQQTDDFTILASALTGILIKNDIIKGIAENFGLLANVVVTTVAGTTDHD